LFDTTARLAVLLDHVTKVTPGREPHLIFGGMTAVLRTDRRTVILGRQGSGKTTLLQLLAKTEPPDGGMIETRARFSMVLNSRGFFYPMMNGIENVEALARIYGMKEKRLAELAARLPGVPQGAWASPVGDLVPRDRRTLEMLTAALLPYDCFLVDDVEKISANTMATFLKLITARKAGAILTTFNTRFGRQYGDAGAVIANRSLRVYDTMEEAATFYG
jgi:ATPase subunit of ABC transporter with duplicated ATPase domains